MAVFHVALAIIGVTFACSANAAPTQMQTDQTAANQKAEAQGANFWKKFGARAVNDLSSYLANEIINGEKAMNQDAEAAGWMDALRPMVIRGVGSYLANQIGNEEMALNQDAKAANFWQSVGPPLVKILGSYLANKIANGEMTKNQEVQAQRLGSIAPYLLHGAGNYFANRIANGQSVQNEKVEAQLWPMLIKMAAPYVIDKIVGGEMAMSEVAKALPEEARAEFWPTVVGGVLSRQLG